jgi:hypothetical protein
MPPISFLAIAMAFAAELVADWIIQMLLLMLFAGDQLHTGMSDEDYQSMVQNVLQTTALPHWVMAFGLATIVAGAYAAARIAKRIPYYHGLAIGIVGVIYTVAASDALDGQTWLGILVTIPLSLFGAHLARKHMPVES